MATVREDAGVPEASRQASLASAASTRQTLRERGLRPHRSRGQNFLTDANILRKIVSAARLSPTDGVLEIGPGLGSLTRELAAAAGRVLAVEVDRGIYDALRSSLTPEMANVVLLHADALALDLPAVVSAHLGAGRHAVAANIPYSLATPLLARLMEHSELFDRTVLMVQAEFADRMTAEPGTRDYSALTLFVRWHCRVERICRVSRHCFVPRPRVDSAVVRLLSHSTPPFPDLAFSAYSAVVRAAFQQRRKTLQNALQTVDLSWDRETAARVLARAGLDGGRRGETLTPEEFAVLARAAAAEGVVPGSSRVWMDEPELD